MNADFFYGYVLHSRRFKETGAIIDVFFEKLGIVSVALNKRQPIKKNSFPSLTPFSPLSIQLKGGGELKTLQTVEFSGVPFSLLGQHLFAGMYLNELILKLTPKYQGLEELFCVYEQTLEALQNKQPIEPVLRAFEFNFFSELGYGIDFEFDSEQEKIGDEQHYQYTYEVGFQPVIMSSANALSGKVIRSIQQLDFSDPEARKGAKQISRVITHALLRGKPLASRMLFRRLPTTKE